MNKKGEIFWLIPTVLVLLFGVWFAMLCIDSYKMEDAKHSSCQSLGYEEARYIGDMWHCMKGSEANYVLFDCKGWWPFTENKCPAKLISIGDVRVVK